MSCWDCRTGARIELLLGTAVIARAEANQLGEWMLALGDGLAPGTYELVIRITTADGRYQLLSDTLISVIVPETAAAASPPFAPQPAGGFTLADLQITIAFGVGAPVVVEGILTGPLRAIVQCGDTLWYIATQFYGDGALYPLIADANRDQIRNVHVLQPGQILLIPISSAIRVAHPKFRWELASKAVRHDIRTRRASLEQFPLTTMIFYDRRH